MTLTNYWIVITNALQPLKRVILTQCEIYATTNQQ